MCFYHCFYPRAQASRVNVIGSVSVYIYIAYYTSKSGIWLVTPHAQREPGKVIGRGVHIYIYLWSKKIFESYFRDRLTFSNVDSRTSR